MAKKTDMEIITEEKISKGGILVKFYFDIQSNEKEKLQPVLVDLINNKLLKEKGVVYGYGRIHDPLEKNGVFITSAVVTLLFENFGSVIKTIFDYVPIGVEVLRPEKELQLKTPELQSILLDISDISSAYSKYILEKVMNREEIKKLNEQLQNRKEMGERVMKGFGNDEK